MCSDQAPKREVQNSGKTVTKTWQPVSGQAVTRLIPTSLSSRCRTRDRIVFRLAATGLSRFFFWSRRFVRLIFFGCGAVSGE